MTNQERFLKQIRKQISESGSLNDAISGILNISYDAAHHRVSGKSKFSINETVQLANHYNISLDDLFFQKEKVIVEKTIEIASLKDMLTYFEQSSIKIEALTQFPDVTLYYSAKDIPLFYFMDGTILSKFKAYVWLSLLNPNQSKITFDNFVIDEFFCAHAKIKKSV